MKPFYFPGTWLFMFLLITSPAFCTTFQGGRDKLITQPVEGDLYVNAKINGDLVAAGGTISVNDSVMGDALLAAGTLVLNGFINDDVRAAGGTIKITENVKGDVVVAGGEIEIAPDVSIFGDLISTGGTTILHGTVKGKVKLLGGEVHLNGTVEKDLEVKSGELFVNGRIMGKSSLAAEEITLMEGARFYQDVAYWQEAGEMNFSNAMAAGKATFRPELQLDIDGTSWYYLGFGSFVFVLWYMLSALLLLFLFEYLFPELMKKAGYTANQDTARVLGYGILYLLGIPVISILLFITIIGIPVGVFTLVFYIFSIIVAHVISSVVLANWYNEKYGQHWSTISLVWVALGFFIGLRLISLIPVAGWLVSIIVVGIAFGAVIDTLRRKPIATVA
jgi:cytoskeletal protein CcmA (bactofilin family)